MPKQNADNSGLAPTPVQAPEPPRLSDIPVKELIAVWKKNHKPEYTDELLKRMRPTMNSALTSYASGLQDHLRIRAANLTLESLETYDPKYGTEPSTHVFNNLKRLNRYARNVNNIIPQSETRQAEYRRIQSAKDEWTDYKGREPSMQELSDITGISQKRLNKLLNQDTMSDSLSESSTLSEDNQRQLLAKTDLTDDDYFEYVYASVGPIDQKIMEWSSGLKGKPALNNNAIAARLHMSAPAVSQRRNRIQQMLSDVRALV